MTVQIDITSALSGLESKLQAETVMRAVSIAMLPVIKERIHVEGKDSSGNSIGTYTNAYLRLRTGEYKNSERFTRGKNKGKVKNAGTFTKGVDTNIYGTIVDEVSKIGKARPNYNREADPKVILSLTRQMENDFTVVAIEKVYGLGYNNSLNFDKAKWLETKYQKKVFGLTESEREQVLEVAKFESTKLLNQ